MNAFILDGTINSRTNLGLRITEPPVIPPAKRIAESVQVDGREGTLTLLKGWEDITFSLKAALLGANLQGRFRDVLPKILSATTIYFSGDNGVFFRIKHVSAGGMERKLTSLGEFSLFFVCDPFRYMRNAAAITMAATGSVINPGTVYALPKITVYGTGSQTLTVNGKLVRLNILSGNLTLDSELMECYRGSTAQNNQMQGVFPVLNPGSNTVTWSGGITKLEIEPRWRYL